MHDDDTTPVVGGRRSVVELTIERLVLPVLSLSDQRAVASAVERELSRLVAERGLPPGMGAGDQSISVAPPVVRVPAGLRPDAIGARVAEAIYAGMAGGEPAAAGQGGNT